MQKILGLGNALVDIMTKLNDDSLLEKFFLPKGSMQLVDKHLSDRILHDISHLPRTMTSGGSAANTIHGLAKMGIETGFAGKICYDEFGHFFLNELKTNHIQPHLSYNDTETGRVIALVSPDSERTFATYLGAAMELSESDLYPGLFDNYAIIHIEGYMVQNHDLLDAAVRMAKEKGLKVSLDLASYNIVDENLAFLHSLIRDNVDIVFANEEEAKAYSGQIPEKALDIIGNECDMAIVKLGEKGSLIKHHDQIITVDGYKIIPVDTTGAGDLYAAGFLYGLIKGYNLEKCGRIASILSAKVIEVIGAKMTDQKWKETYAILRSESLLSESH
jgi:sugar/nucleoside kinase (ribokinase family)